MEMDKDLLARQEARSLAKKAERAQNVLARMPQEKLDTIVKAVAEAFAAEAKDLAELAVKETGFGNVCDKETKNLFASKEPWTYGPQASDIMQEQLRLRHRLVP